MSKTDWSGLAFFAMLLIMGCGPGLLILFGMTMDRLYYKRLRRHVADATVEPVDQFDTKITTKSGVAYIGSGTVWHVFPTGERCPTPLEGMLSDVAQAAEWKARGIA